MGIAEHEDGLAAFLVPERRARFRDSLRTPRLRRTLRSELCHFEHRLDARYAKPHEMHVRHEAHVAQIHDLLVAAGAPATCFVLSDTDDDGHERPLRQALEDLIWSGAGLISCVPGRLGLYVGEEGSSVIVLRRRA